MAVNNDQLKKMLDDAGIAYAPDATQAQLLELMAGALASGSTDPVFTTYDVISTIDVSSEEGKQDIKNAGETVELDATHPSVQEWLTEGVIKLHVEASATVQAPAPVVPATDAGVEEGRSVVQAIIDQQNEEQKVKEMFDLSTKEGRWQNFLYNARKVNPARFDAQFAAGEFDTIPHTFEAPELEKSVGSPSGKAAA